MGSGKLRSSVGRFALLLLPVLGGVACNSKAVLLTPRDGGAGAGGASGVSGAGGGTSGSSGAGGSSVGGASGAAAGDGGSASGGTGGGVGATGGASGTGDGGASGTGGGGASGTGGTGVLQCSDETFADCTSAPGCETMLGTDTDCASCGDRSCAIANTLFSCSSANGCTSAVCAVGYANCDRSSPDCEAIIAAGASCLPTYRGTVGYVTVRYGSAAAAIATDGSTFFGGVFTGTVRFGTAAAPDIRTVAAPGDIDGFITRFNADGSYAWTRAFPSSGGVDIFGHEAPPTINALAATADGGVVMVGSYSGTIDLDPGDAVDLHQTMLFGRREAFVVKLAADGSLAWGGTFASQSIDASGDAGGVVIDGAGAIFVAGSYAGEVDLDPSAGTATHSSRSNGAAAVAGVLVKLTPAGKLSWVKSMEGGGSCVPAAGSITLATDGAIWILGGASIASFAPDGSTRGCWLTQGGARSIAAGPSGSVFIGGSAWGLPDFDPGPGVARRLVGTSLTGGFIVKLGSDGGYLWDQTIPGGEIFSVAGTRDGGVLGLGYLGVTKLNADGTAGWTFSSGQIPGLVVSSPTGFVVTGSNGNGGTDMDPGPSVDMVGAVTLYLSRFDY